MHALILWAGPPLMVRPMSYLMGTEGHTLTIGYRGRPIEAILECVSDQGSGHGMVTADPTVDIAQQTLPLFDGDAAL